MDKKIIAISIFSALVGAAAGWAARGYVYEKNKELQEGNIVDNNPDYIPNEEDYEKVNKIVSETGYSNTVIKFNNQSYSQEEQEAIEEANAESAAPSDDDEDDNYDDQYEEDEDAYDDDTVEYYDPQDDMDDYAPVIPNGYDEYVDDDDFDEDDEDEPETKIINKTVWPYEIDEQDFDAPNEYDKSTLEFYKNRILIDEDGSEITNPGAIVGDGILKHLLLAGGKAYVRNEPLEIDYEIIFVDEEYERYHEE